MPSDAFMAGHQAFRAGVPKEANPYICGTTKRGSAIFTDAEDGMEWRDGWERAKPARICSEEEMQGAIRMRLRVGRLHNPQYRR